MKQRLAFLGLFVAIMTLTACKSENEVPPAPAAVADHYPAADAEQLWTYITETSPYTTWEFWPGKTDLYPGKSPHGAYLKLYANPVAIKAAREGRPMPEQALLVKENYDQDQTTLLAITPMYRVKDYNPAAGDWFWANYEKDGQLVAAGRLQDCINCHRAVEGQDWLFNTAE